MAWRRRTPRPGEQQRVLIVIVVLAFVTPLLRQLIFGGDRSLLHYFATYFVVFFVLMALAFATRLVRFGWERAPDGAAD